MLRLTKNYYKLNKFKIYLSQWLLEYVWIIIIIILVPWYCMARKFDKEFNLTVWWLSYQPSYWFRSKECSFLDSMFLSDVKKTTSMRNSLRYICPTSTIHCADSFLTATAHGLVVFCSSLCQVNVSPTNGIHISIGLLSVA